MTEHTEHTPREEQITPTQQTEHTHQPHQPQQPQQRQQTDQIETVITFNGLLVFRPDQINKVCEVGVLHTRDHAHPHFLQIEIEPDPDTGTGKKTLDPELLESYVRAGNIKWRLDVVRNGQPASAGIVVDEGIPANRRAAEGQNKEDFGWIVNIESGEFHSGPLVRTPRKLKPILLLSKGELFTRCMTDMIDVKQGPNTRLNFGYIAGAIGLRLKPADGDMAILYFRDQHGMPTEIFRLPNINNTSYAVSIRNTPRQGPSGGHFHLFYDRLFQGVGPNQRFDILPHYPPIGLPIPPRCPDAVDPDPDPFRCGGVAVGPSGGPLG